MSFYVHQEQWAYMVKLAAMQPTKNNKNLLMHFKGYEDFVSRILDLVDRAKRYQKVIFTPFLNEKERSIVYSVASDCFLYEDGGYEESEVKRMAISAFEEETIDFPIVALSDTFDEKYHKISHRDVLGALMNLGIKREVLGDILIIKNRIVIFVEAEMAEYVIQNLNQVKRASIVLRHYEEEVSRNDAITYKEGVIASFRADVIVATLCHLSRDKAKQLIRSGKVKVNQVVLEDYDYLCNNNSTVSVRGYGKYILHDLEKKTKKNHFLIRIGKYL